MLRSRNCRRFSRSALHSMKFQSIWELHTSAVKQPYFLSVASAKQAAGKQILHWERRRRDAAWRAPEPRRSSCHEQPWSTQPRTKQIAILPCGWEKQMREGVREVRCLHSSTRIFLKKKRKQGLLVFWKKKRRKTWLLISFWWKKNRQSHIEVNKKIWSRGASFLKKKGERGKWLTNRKVEIFFSTCEQWMRIFPPFIDLTFSTKSTTG